MPITIPGYYSNIAISLLCPFIVIMLGFCLPCVRIKKDITYGLFLYHWIVLNVMIHLKVMETCNWVLCLIIFFGISIMLAYISNSVINKIYHKYYIREKDNNYYVN